MALGPVCWVTLYLLEVPLRKNSIALSTLVLIALVYPVLEEYVFRGGIQSALYSRSSLSRSIAGVSAANLLTSITFAVIHLFNQPPIWATLVFFPSLVFGWMRDRYGHIGPSVVLHVVYNAGFFLFFSG